MPSFSISFRRHSSVSVKLHQKLVPFLPILFRRRYCAALLGSEKRVYSAGNRSSRRHIHFRVKIASSCREAVASRNDLLCSVPSLLIDPSLYTSDVLVTVKIYDQGRRVVSVLISFLRPLYVKKHARRPAGHHGRAGTHRPWRDRRGNVSHH